MIACILLVLAAAAILLACFAWGRSDEDDLVRKFVVSLVQIMCLLTIVLGVGRAAQLSAVGPPPPEEVASAPVSSAQRPTPPSVPATHIMTQAENDAIRRDMDARNAEDERLARARMENEKRMREQAEAERQARSTLSDPSAVGTPPAGAPSQAPPPESTPTETNPPSTEAPRPTETPQSSGGTAPSGG